MVVGFVTNAFAATQDVAVDGMAIDVPPMNERGRANAFMAFGQVAGSSSFGALCGTLLPVIGLSMTASLCAVTVAAIFITVIALFMNLCWTKVAATQFAVYMAFANVGIASGGFLFYPVADYLTFGQDFLIMAGLFAVSAFGLVFFKEAAHARRLEALRARAFDDVGGSSMP